MTLLRPAILAGLLMSALVSPCAAAIPYGQRTDAFRRLLFELRFRPLRNFDELHDKPSNSVLIVLGDPSCLSKHFFPNGLRWFVQHGGALLLATDKRTEGEAGQLLSELVGVRISGEKLYLPLGTAVYEGEAFCPFVQPMAANLRESFTDILGGFAPEIGLGERPNLFRNPRPGQSSLQVATNAPSRLWVDEQGLPWSIYRLAQLPAGCVDPPFLIVPTEGIGSPTPPLFAVGGTLGKGRILVLADHSLFINRMILPSNNGNLEFAANCLNYLRGGISMPAEALRAANDPHALAKLLGQRDKVLLWEDGSIAKKFEVPLQTVPRKPPFDMAPAIFAAIDRAVGNMEDSDLFNRNLEEQIDALPGGWPRVLRGGAYGATLAACLFLGYIFVWRGLHRRESAVPLLAHAVRRQQPTKPLLEQRRRASLRSGNLWDIAHQLTRQYFESAGLPLTGASAPRLVMHGGWRQRWRARRRLARLWKLARGEASARLSPAAFNRWLREMEELKTDLRGEWPAITT